MRKKTEKNWPLRYGAEMGNWLVRPFHQCSQGARHTSRFPGNTDRNHMRKLLDLCTRPDRGLDFQDWVQEFRNRARHCCLKIVLTVKIIQKLIDHFIQYNQIKQRQCVSSNGRFVRVIKLISFYPSPNLIIFNAVILSDLFLSKVICSWPILAIGRLLKLFHLCRQFHTKLFFVIQNKEFT